MKKLWTVCGLVMALYVSGVASTGTAKSIGMELILSTFTLDQAKGVRTEFNIYKTTYGYLNRVNVWNVVTNNKVSSQIRIFVREDQSMGDGWVVTEYPDNVSTEEIRQYQGDEMAPERAFLLGLSKLMIASATVKRLYENDPRPVYFVFTLDGKKDKIVVNRE